MHLKSRLQSIRKRREELKKTVIKNIKIYFEK